MPSFQITTETHAWIRERAIERGCTHDAVVAELLTKAMPAFDPDELVAYEFGGLLVAYYGKRFAGVLFHATPDSHDTYAAHRGPANQHTGRGTSRKALTEWSPWFAPIVAGRRPCG